MKRRLRWAIWLTLFAVGCWGRFVDIGGDTSSSGAPEASTGDDGSAPSTEPPKPVTPDAVAPVGTTGPDASGAQDDGATGGLPPPMCDPTAPRGPCTDTQNDPRNCGACGHDCLGGPCNAGKCGACALVASPYIDAIALDDTYAYYTEMQPGAVSKVPLSGGAPTTLATQLLSAFSLSLGPTSAYVAQWEDRTSSSVQSIPKNGGAPTVLARLVGIPAEWGFDGTAIYLSMDDGGFTSQFTTTIVPLDGGPTGTMEAGVLRGVNDGALYFKPLAGGLSSRTIDGGPIRTLWADGSVDAVAFHGSYVYALRRDNNPGSLLRMPAGGGAPEMLLDGILYSGSLAVDESGAYWGEDSVLRRRAPDGTVETLYRGVSHHFQGNIALDANAAYWIDQPRDVSSLLVKLAK
jgi:hypothetical protein